MAGSTELPTDPETRRRIAPPRHRRWGKRLGFTLVVVAGLLALALATALPAVLDLRPWLLATAASGATLLLVARRRFASRKGRAAAVAFAAAGLVAAVLASWDLTLAYRTEEVSFTQGDVTLRGTLYLPRRGDGHPGLVLIHGSGVQPRDESRFYARQYARRGVAALAYDKRGSGASSGNAGTATYQELAADVVRAIALLRRHPRIDPTRVGIWGLSEGEWVAPLAAQQSDPAFLVLVSASALTPAEQVRHEVGANVRRAGFAEAEAQRAAELYALVSRFERTGEGRDELNRLLGAARAEPWFAAARYLPEDVPEYDRVLALPWFPAWRARMDFDALAVLSTLRCPVLALTGGADPKSDGAAAIERLRAALARGGNRRFTGVTFPHATHNVVEWRLPGGMPPPFFAAGYLETQVDWVRRQVGLETP
jgi:alpha-beta hydrolase superfamily lysophospholipase